MGKIYQNGIQYTNDSNTVSVELTYEEYMQLSEAEKMNGTTYYVTDNEPTYNMDNSAVGNTPIGTIISVMGTSAPKNFLICNGQVLNITTYPQLAHYFKTQFGSVNYFGGDGTTTFAVPDLRGEFLRGAGTNSHENQGDGGNVGDHQNATTIPFINVNTAGTRLLARKANTTDGNQPTNMDYELRPTKNSSGVTTTYDSAGGLSEAFGDKYTTRPTNTSVLYCIAYKNIYVDVKQDYSYEEKEIGYWVDGKPLYQKTIEDTMPVVATNGTAVYKNVNHNIVDEDLFFVVYAFCLLPDFPARTFTHPMPYTTNAGYQLKTRVGRGVIELSSSSKDFNAGVVYITIQYTKTTD